MSYLSPLTLVVALLSSCAAATITSSSSSIQPHIQVVPGPVRPPHSVSLHHGETRTFAPAALRPGDALTCELGGQLLRLRIPNRPGSGWAIGTGAATRSGGTGELQADGNPDGTITASC